jgi:hypothetical protein
MAERIASAPQPLPDVPDPEEMPIRPVPRTKVDGKEWGRRFIQRAWGTPLEDETPEDMAWRIRQQNAMLKRLEALPGTPTPEEVRAALMDHYENIVGPVEVPVQEFDPEARRALLEAFAPTPDAQGLRYEDVDQAELMAALGYGLANLFRGGSFADAVRMLGKVADSAQARADRRNEKAREDAELRRRMAIEEWRRLNQIADANFQQRGYDARDARALQRQQAMADATAERQRAYNEQILERQLAAAYFDFLAKGDPARAAQVKEYMESVTGDRYSDSFVRLPKTADQELKQAQARATDVKAMQGLEALRGMGLENDFKDATFDERVRRIFLGNVKLEEEIGKLREEVKYLPQKMQADIARTWASVQEIRQRSAANMMRAEAAMIQAQARAAGGSGKAEKPPEKGLGRLGIDLRGMLSGLDREHANVWKELEQKYKELSAAEKALNEAKYFASRDPGAVEMARRRVQSLGDQIRSLNAKRGDLERRISDVNRQMEELLRKEVPQQIPPGYVPDGMGGFKPKGSAK